MTDRLSGRSVVLGMPEYSRCRLHVSQYIDSCKQKANTTWLGHTVVLVVLWQLAACFELEAWQSAYSKERWQRLIPVCVSKGTYLGIFYDPRQKVAERAISENWAFGNSTTRFQRHAGFLAASTPPISGVPCVSLEARCRIAIRGKARLRGRLLWSLNLAVLARLAFGTIPSLPLLPMTGSFNQNLLLRAYQESRQWYCQRHVR